MSSDDSTQPYEREPFAFPTRAAFEQSVTALKRLAVFSVEMQYPKGEADEEFVERADQLVEDLKALQSDMAESRGLTRDEWFELVCGNADDVFETDAPQEAQDDG